MNGFDRHHRCRLSARYHHVSNTRKAIDCMCVYVRVRVCVCVCKREKRYDDEYLKPLGSG